MRCNYLNLVVVACVCFLHSGYAVQAATAEPKPEVTTPEPATGSAEKKIVPGLLKGPSITFDKLVCNLGNIKPGSRNVCEFKFGNIGDSLLKITEVTKTCGCTPFTLEKKEYAPGESGILKVEYHASRRPSSIKKILYVSSNDKKMPRVGLAIIGEIVGKFSYNPKKLNLVLNKENGGCPKITIRSLDGEAFSIKQFKATSKTGENIITADYNPSVKATEFVLQPRVDVEKLRGELGGSIEIVAACPENEAVTIPFTVVPRFKVSPSSLIIYKAQLDKPVARELWILSNYGEDFEVKSASSQEGAIRVLNQERVDNRYKFELEIMPPASKKGRKGFFTDTFSVTLKDGEVLKIPCRMFYVKKEEKAPHAAGKTSPAEKEILRR